MNQSYLAALKVRLAPRLDAARPTGELEPAEHAGVFALYGTLTCDPDVAPGALATRLNDQTASRPGYLRELRDGLVLLDAAAARRDPGRTFRDLSARDREAALRDVLREFPFPGCEPAWRRRLRLTRENLDGLFGDRRTRRFRCFVVRELLAYYYTTAGGWAVVGYRAFPGRSRAELEPCVVRSLAVEGGRLVLALSDGSFEPLEPAALVLDGDAGFAVWVKRGRQRAGFSRAAGYALGEHLAEVDGETVLRVVVGPTARVVSAP